MNGSRIALHVTATMVMVLGAAVPVRAETNTLMVPFHGTVPGPTENIAVSGNLMVKTVHYPGVTGKAISTSFKIDKGSSSGVGMTSGTTFATRGQTKSKFKYIFPTATPPTRISTAASWCIFCCPLGSPPCMCCYPLQVQLAFDAGGQVMSGESGATVQAPPAQGSCTNVVQVCNH